MNRFNVKKVKCNVSDIHTESKSMEMQWLEALLLRIGVPSLIIKRRAADKMDNNQWRHYLLDSFKVEVHNDMSNSTVSVNKFMEGDREGELEKIAEWSSPEVIRINKMGERPYCELRLKYWQLI